MTVEIRTLNINTDFEFDFYLSRKNASTRLPEAATGLTGIVGRFASGPTGVALGGTSTALSEAASTAHYVGVVDTATLVAALMTYVGRIVYAIVSKTGDLDCEVQPYRVATSHQIGTT